MELPEGMKEYLRSLQASIDTQEATIESLRAKNKRLEEKLKNSESYTEELRLQSIELIKEISELKEDRKRSGHEEKKVTEGIDDSNEAHNQPGVSITDGSSITEQITMAANKVVHDQFLEGMAFEETSGLYYDYKSGYYYDAERQMYYNGKSGTYYKYNYDTQEYEILDLTDPSGRRRSDSESSSSSSISSNASSRGSRKRAGKRGKEEAKKSDDLKLSEGEVSSPSPPPPKKSAKDRPAGQQRKKNKHKKGKHSSYEKGYEKQPLTVPCIRVVVHATSSESDIVLVGTLFIVTCKGGSIGREGEHDVLLDDIACSKFHGKIEFNLDDYKYYLIDMGSRNGTFVDGKRISVSKCESSPKEIGHGTLIQIGSTKLICHVHPGNETCYKCEPGVIQSALPKLTPVISKEDKELKRKSEMKQIRKKYGIGNDVSESAATITKKSGYVDRADNRRKTKGSDNPHEKTEVASVTTAIGQQNKGFKMLAKMGWKDGAGLGKDCSGRTEPVGVDKRAERSGLGSFATAIKVDASLQRRVEVIRKTQERFDQIS
jgi:hypothetical protein